MRLDQFVSRQRVIDLQSDSLEGSVRELLVRCSRRFKDLNREALLKGLMQRESTMTTYLGFGVALPHVRVRMKRRYILAVGRSQEGIQYDGLKENEKIHIILLLIAGERSKDYLQVLASIARLVKEKAFVDSLIQAPDEDHLYERLMAGIGGGSGRPVAYRQNRINRVIFRQAERVARGAHCSGVLLFGDTFDSPVAKPKWTSLLRTLLVTHTTGEISEEDSAFDDIIQVRSFSNHRLAQLRSAVIVGLTRGILTFNDRLCCIGGIPGSNQFDTLVVVDVEQEFQTLFTAQQDLLPSDVKPEVLERVLAVATELAVEGREGRPIGGLFVVGDSSKVEKFTKPLIMNPFFGYKEEDRNILNPFMDETIKEFSSIDGAFVIRGDGLVLSAGTLIQASHLEEPLPSGLGTRHAAAAAISIATDCISIVVSSSSGQITLFRKGVMLSLNEKRVGGTG